MSDTSPVIAAKNVWKLFGPDPKGYLNTMAAGRSYEDIRADGYIAGVKDVSIEVGRGEMLVIMGLSGSGKSTLVRCFSRLHDITGGTIGPASGVTDSNGQASTFYTAGSVSGPATISRSRM